MSHWGYVIEEITHGHDNEDEQRARRLRARARSEAPPRERRRASWVTHPGQLFGWGRKAGAPTTDAPCARASSLSRLAQ